MGWAVMPFGENIVIADVNLGILVLLAISSLNVYGVIMSGWASILSTLFWVLCVVRLKWLVMKCL